MSRLPITFKKLVGTQLGTDLAAITKVVDAKIDTLAAGNVVVRNLFAGVNASDVNFAAGRYQKITPPFDTGFESIGQVAAVGEGCEGIKVGQPVGVLQFGAFSEYQVVNAKAVLPLPSVAPTFLPLLVSGLTASLALDKVADLKKGGGETVLVTAAGGATGVFAVQLAKRAGNHVIGTCSDDAKKEFLLSLGCDRVVNYKKEDLDTVLRTEYPKGVDVVYESVGGSMFETCVNHLAVHGRLVVIGMISGYLDQSAFGKPSGPAASPLPVRLLSKSASVRGFFLNNFAPFFGEHLFKLAKMVENREIQSVVDTTATFKGLESVPAAVKHMYSGGNIGKVIIDLSGDGKAKL